LTRYPESRGGCLRRLPQGEEVIRVDEARIDVSVFIELFIYDENRSNRARGLFRLIGEEGA